MRDSKDNNKPYIIEVNGCPGLAGVESVTGENVAEAIVNYVLENYKRRGNKKLTANNGATAEDLRLKPQSFEEWRAQYMKDFAELYTNTDFLKL
jgi:hypothetical protein